jgi:hypothetical protein
MPNPPSRKTVSERSFLQKADIRWILCRHQTCADCLRPQRMDYWADDEQWMRVVGDEGGCLCIECYLRRCDAFEEIPLVDFGSARIWFSFDHDESDRIASDICNRLMPDLPNNRS